MVVHKSLEMNKKAVMAERKRNVRRNRTFLLWLDLTDVIPDYLALLMISSMVAKG